MQNRVLEERALQRVYECSRLSLEHLCKGLTQIQGNLFEKTRRNLHGTHAQSESVPVAKLKIPCDGRGTKKPLDESEKESEKVGLKLNIQKTKIMASGPITSWEIDGETVETVSDFISLGSKNHCRW